MQSGKWDPWIALAGFALATALAVDWASGAWLQQQPWLVRGTIVGLTALLAYGCLAWHLRRSGIDRRAVVSHLEAVARLDANQWAAGLPPTTLSGRRSATQTAAALDRLNVTLVAAGRRLQELEQARAAWEIRTRRNEAHYERVGSILSGLSEPVIAIDNYGELVLANPSAERLFDLPRGATAQRALDQLLHCEKLVELLTDTRRRKTPSQRTAEVEIADGQGRSHWYSVTARTLASPIDAGPAPEINTQGAVAVLRDISLQKAIQKRNAEFVSAVSHEMKTPLAGIKAYVELLADGDAEDPETQEEFLAVINSQANRLQRLVDNLLNLARIEAGVVSVSKQSRSLNEMLEEALRVLQPAAEKKQITLSGELSPLYLGVLVDRDMILQAAINLLSNAIKYTPEGGKVVLRSRWIDDEIRFEVADNGVGLSGEDCTKVFEKFYRVQKDKDMAAGTGLGLPLAKHIVEDVHGGKLTVESVLGQGSVFAVTLPGAGQMN